MHDPVQLRLSRATNRHCRSCRSDPATASATAASAIAPGNYGCYTAAMLALAVALALALPAPEPVAIRHVSVVNVVSGRIQKDVTVLLVDGTITAIGKKDR